MRTKILTSRARLYTIALALIMVGAVLLGYILAQSRAAGSALVGDINVDGVVNVFDLSILLSHWGTNDAASDLNGDGTVNIFDLSSLLSHWGQTAPTPTPSATVSPSPTPTPSVSPSPTPSPTGMACFLATFGACGPYLYPAITPSNGYNTYVANQDGACGGDTTGKYCGAQALTSYNPGNFSLTATMPAGYDGVRSYPDIGQLFNNWGSGGFNGGSDMPVTGVSAISSTYAETMNENSGTYAEAAYDIWTSTNEVMVWVDTTPLRGSGGAVQKGTGTLSGYPFTYYVYSDGNPADPPLPIIKLNTNQRTGTIDLLAAIKYFQSQGVVASNATVDQLNFGWEICSTGGLPETFSVSNYSLTVTPK